ncbi:MAG: hypothetical protein ACO1SV_13920 [Fimbriimonas sp.]
MKRLVLGLGMAMGAIAPAQIPDVKVRLDAIMSYRQDLDGASKIRYYSVFGQFGTAALIFQLEPGFTGFLSQKLERIPNDPDRDSVDEAYIEDEGIWRVGKQYLPFGSSNILRESVIAARADTSLIVEELPVRIAFADGGTGRQRGVVARLGSNIGASVAFGEHFGINGTALTLIRRPEESPGRGRGWRRAFGFDANQRYGPVDVRGEAVLLRDGHTSLDRNLAIFDLSARLIPNGFSEITLGYTREATTGRDFIRAIVEVEGTENVSFRPFTRFRGGRLWDLGIEVRVRL